MPWRELRVQSLSLFFFTNQNITEVALSTGKRVEHGVQTSTVLGGDAWLNLSVKWVLALSYSLKAMVIECLHCARLCRFNGKEDGPSPEPHGLLVTRI